MNNTEFMQWFGKEVKTRWPRHTFRWTEMGDWHWRLGDFDVDTLTQAVRRHRACEDWKVPSLKKVYEYASAIRDKTNPPQKQTGQRSFPEAHTFIMCTARDDRGNGTPGVYVDIILWPFNKTWAAADYRRVAAEQARKHQSTYGGVWEVFTQTNCLEMMKRCMKLRNPHSAGAEYP